MHPVVDISPMRWLPGWTLYRPNPFKEVEGSVSSFELDFALCNSQHQNLGFSGTIQKPQMLGRTGVKV
jgi:hypothetical protein